jgi:hypothetical protein
MPVYEHTLKIQVTRADEDLPLRAVEISTLTDGGNDPGWLSVYNRRPSSGYRRGQQGNGEVRG